MHSEYAPQLQNIIHSFVFRSHRLRTARAVLAIIQTLDNNDSIGFNDLAYLTDKLRETAVNVLPKEQYGVMTTESIVAFLGSQERAVKVCNESSCLAELGRMVSADYVAQGRIGRFGRDLTIKVELYSVKSGNLIGSFTGDSKDIYGLRDIINEKATDLFKKMPNTSNVKKAVPPPVVATPVAPSAPQDIPPVKSVVPIVKGNEEYVAYLIKNGVEKNKEEIKKESFYLSSFYKEALYEENRKKYATGWAALNVLPGLGVGSYIQGDISLGIIQSISDVIGWSINYYAYLYGSHQQIYTYQQISVVILGTSRLIGLIVPFYHQSKYNETLKKALNIKDDDYEKTVDYFSLSIDPLIVPRDGTPAVGLAFNVRY